MFELETHHSTCHQIQRISEIIVHCFESKQYMVAAFLDLTQTFDNVRPCGLELKLKAHDLPTYLSRNITSFITDRTFQIRIDSSQSHKIKARVPQRISLKANSF